MLPYLVTEGPSPPHPILSASHATNVLTPTEGKGLSRKPALDLGIRVNERGGGGFGQRPAGHSHAVPGDLAARERSAAQAGECASQPDCLARIQPRCPVPDV